MEKRLDKLPQILGDILLGWAIAGLILMLAVLILAHVHSKPPTRYNPGTQPIVMYTA